MSSKLQIAQKFVKLLTENKGFDKCLKKLKVVSCDDDKCVCELRVDDEHLNGFGTMHGGFIATVVDVVTSVALITQHPENAGVSVNLNVNYMRPGKCGSDMLLDASVVKLGKKLAYLKIDIKEKDTGKIIATGTHTKFL